MERHRRVPRCQAQLPSRCDSNGAIICDTLWSRVDGMRSDRQRGHFVLPHRPTISGVYHPGAVSWIQIQIDSLRSTREDRSAGP